MQIPCTDGPPTRPVVLLAPGGERAILFVGGRRRAGPIMREADDVVLPISEVAARLGIDDSAWVAFGRDKAKVSIAAVTDAWQRSDPAQGGRRGRLILVTAITPTKAGEGKTTTSIGLADALALAGKRSALALREPSLGPSLGMKGGATGGGLASVHPEQEINLHFTGDMHAITTANNWLAALLDNELHFGNALALDPRQVTFHRVIDMDDRALRHAVIGLGGRTDGMPREEEFLITAASEVMAAFCLAADATDLERRCNQIMLGWRRDGTPVSAGELGNGGAGASMAALLEEAFQPNLVQSLAGTPALIHGGPFANIAHGTNSIVATRLALSHAEYVVTEAGFGSDLGAEKFVDIAARAGGFAPDVIVLVASVRALKLHGGLPEKELASANAAALERGLANLDAHLAITRRIGVPVVVAVNRFPADTVEELDMVVRHCAEHGVAAAVSEVFAHGGEGGLALAREVIAAAETPAMAAAQAAHTTQAASTTHTASTTSTTSTASTTRTRPNDSPSTLPRATAGLPFSAHPFYEEGLPVSETLSILAHDVYGASGVVLESKAQATLYRLQRAGLDHLPVCVAKTQYSLSDEAGRGGVVEEPWQLHVRELRPSTGAGFIVALAGDIMTMPGLPKEPAGLALRAENKMAAL